MRRPAIPHRMNKMKTFIALFRGINVGGNNRLPMKELVSVLDGLGLKNVRTYIQSGNVVFQSATSNAVKLSRDIRAAIEESHGFAPHVLILSVREFQKAIASNPFPEGEGEPKSLHLFFLESIPDNPDMDRLDRLKTDREEFRLVDAIFYLHTPDGIGRSKLAASVEKAMGVALTARNWRSVTKIMELAVDLAE